MSDQEKRKILKGHLVQADVVEAIAERYVDILFQHGVGSIEKLRKKMDKNETFLLELGFDDTDAEDIRQFSKSTSTVSSAQSRQISGGAVRIKGQADFLVTS